MRENFLELYQGNTEEEARSFFERWYLNVIRSTITAVKKAAKTIKRYLEGTLHQIGNTRSNARAEQTNSKIAKLQQVARATPSSIICVMPAASLTVNWTCSHTIND